MSNPDQPAPDGGGDNCDNGGKNCNNQKFSGRNHGGSFEEIAETLAAVFCWGLAAWINGDHPIFASVLYATGFVILALLARIWCKKRWEKSRWPNFACAVAIIAIAVYCGFNIRKIQHAATPKESPDLALHFVYPKSPALVIENKSGAIAREIKWWMALWNIDLPQSTDSLPIPAATFDWIKPHHRGGPQGLFNRPEVARLIKPGNRIIGSVMATCPDCPGTRTILVSIRFGEGGWFAEAPEHLSGKMIVPKKLDPESREASFRQFEALVPRASRTSISNP